MVEGLRPQQLIRKFHDGAGQVDPGWRFLLGEAEWLGWVVLRGWVEMGTCLTSRGSLGSEYH